MDFNDQEIQDVKTITQNRVDYEKGPEALKQRWDDQMLARRDLGPRAMPIYTTKGHTTSAGSVHAALQEGAEEQS